MSRYVVQERFPELGKDGQSLLRKARVVIVGLGALGGACANILARAGVGSLRLLDMDRPCLENLHRQMLYSEEDIAKGFSKVRAGAEFLKKANSEIEIEDIETKLNSKNALELISQATVVIDGLDNLEGRFDLNEACQKLKIPWVHAGLYGAYGQVLVIKPGETCCLKCLVNSKNLSKQQKTVKTHGVWSPLPVLLGSIQANEALKIILGADSMSLKGLLMVDLWSLSFKVLTLDHNKLKKGCPLCANDT